MTTFVRSLFFGLLVTSSLFVFSTEASAKRYMVCWRRTAVIVEEVFENGVRVGLHYVDAGFCGGGDWFIELGLRKPNSPNEEQKPGFPTSAEVVKMLNAIPEEKWRQPIAKAESDISKELVDRREKGKIATIYVDASKLPPYIAKSLEAEAAKKP